MSAALALGAGFLLAVLWFDLMFDVQVLGQADSPLPEEVLASIAAYYRRVTTQARPMSYFVGLVMVTTLGGALVQCFRSTGPLTFRLATLGLVGVPITTAFVRTLPRAMRFGARTDSAHIQSALARAICRDHLVIFPAIAAFGAIQLLAPAAPP